MLKNIREKRVSWRLIKPVNKLSRVPAIAEMTPFVSYYLPQGSGKDLIGQTDNWLCQGCFVELFHVNVYIEKPFM